MSSLEEKLPYTIKIIDDQIDTAHTLGKTRVRFKLNPIRNTVKEEIIEYYKQRGYTLTFTENIAYDYIAISWANQIEKTKENI